MKEAQENNKLPKYFIDNRKSRARLRTRKHVFSSFSHTYRSSDDDRRKAVVNMLIDLNLMNEPISKNGEIDRIQIK